MKGLKGRVTAVIATFAALLAAGAPAALAHDALMSASPAIDSEVDEFPTEIVLTFSGQMKDDFNTVAVTNQDTGEILFDAEPEIDGFDVIVPVPAGVDPAPGNYVVGYQVTSSDGHATRGSSRFRFGDSNAASDVDAAAPVPTDTEAAATVQPAEDTDAAASNDDADGITQYLWLFVGVFVVVLIIAGITFGYWRRRE